MPIRTEKQTSAMAMDSLSTKASQNVLTSRARAFGNDAQLRQLQSASAAFLRAKQAFHDAQAAKVNSTEQK
jgi:hypothetical protein